MLNITGKSFGDLNVCNVLSSQNDDVFKIVFRKQSDRRVILETVDFTYAQETQTTKPGREHRWVLCISTQSGCPVACTFCGTGSRFIGDLTADDIVQQVYASIRMHGSMNPHKSERFQIMLMAMGEPTLNAVAVCNGIERLHAEFPNSELLISTMGGSKKGFDRFLDLAERIPAVGLQISMHATKQHERDHLIPYPHKMSIEELKEYGVKFYKRTGRLAYLNFILFPDKPNQIAEIITFLHGVDRNVFHITLAHLYDTPFQRHGTCRQSDFDELADFLTENSYDSSVFCSAGIDIGAGCGQLWYVQNHLSTYGRIMPWANMDDAKAYHVEANVFRETNV